MTNQDPIPLDLALKAVRRAKEIEAAAESGPWRSPTDVFDPPDAAFIVLARATYGAMLEPIQEALGRECAFRSEPMHSAGNEQCKMGHHEIKEYHWLYPVIAALISHLDQTQPEWRVK